MESTQELLISAREIFVQHGGAKGTLQDPVTGKICFQGALNWALTGSPTQWDWDELLRDAYRILNDVISEFDSRCIGLAGSFNDGHSFEDVLAVFDKAIVREKA